MTININNTQHTIADSSSLEELLKIKNISSKGIAIAINNTIISMQEWDTILLKEHDNITIIQATQGG